MVRTFHLSLLEKCKPHLGSSASQDQTLVLAGLAFSPSSDELERSSSPDHGHSANGIQREIKVKGQKLGTVTSFKYLGAVVSDDGSKPEVLSRIEQATAALTKLKPIWRDNISLGSKVKLMRSLVISIFPYACESWTLTAELEKRTQAFEMRCYRRLLNILYKDHVTNEEVRRKIQAAI